MFSVEKRYHRNTLTVFYETRPGTRKSYGSLRFGYAYRKFKYALGHFLQRGILIRRFFEMLIEIMLFFDKRLSAISL